MKQKEKLKLQTVDETEILNLPSTGNRDDRYSLPFKISHSFFFGAGKAQKEPAPA